MSDDIYRSEGASANWYVHGKRLIATPHVRSLVAASLMLMALAENGAHAGGLGDSLKGLLNAISPVQNTASAPASQPPANPTNPFIASPNVTVRNVVSTSADAYDFKGDALGMPLSAFLERHHSPGIFIIQNTCEESKCKSERVWQSEYKCNPFSDRINVCVGPVKFLDDISGTADYVFVDAKLAIMMVNFSSRGNGFKSTIEALTGKFGPFSIQTTTQNFGFMTHWENQRSILELTEHQCISTPGIGGLMTSIPFEITNAMSGTMCNHDSGVIYGSSLLMFVDKQQAQSTLDAVAEAKDKAAAKARANI